MMTQPTPHESRLLRVAEFAERSGLQPTTIRAWIRQRKLDVVRLSPRAIRIPEHVLYALIESGYHPATPSHEETTL